MTGGGFGGCIVALVRSESADALIQHVLQRYREVNGLVATPYKTRPGPGAHVLATPKDRRGKAQRRLALLAALAVRSPCGHCPCVCGIGIGIGVCPLCSSGGLY